MYFTQIKKEHRLSTAKLAEKLLGEAASIVMRNSSGREVVLSSQILKGLDISEIDNIAARYQYGCQRSFTDGYDFAVFRLKESIQNSERSGFPPAPNLKAFTDLVFGVGS